MQGALGSIHILCYLKQLIKSILAISVISFLSQVYAEEPPTNKPSIPEIGLILPLRSPLLSDAAQAVLAGFKDARIIHANTNLTSQSSLLPQLHIFETDGSPEELHQAYRKAENAKVKVVVGALTRSEVAAISGITLTVPTLALNIPEEGQKLPGLLFCLSLGFDLEARSLAQNWLRAPGQQAILVYTANPSMRRAGLAFQQKWQQLGGEIVQIIQYNGQPQQTIDVLQSTPAHTVFWAVDAESLLALFPHAQHIPEHISSSQVYAELSNLKKPQLETLNNLVIPDLPWLHQRDHPGVMSYQRPQHTRFATLDMERLYALGIDAFRVVMLIQSPISTPRYLDGVTGELSIAPGIIGREPLFLQYQKGVVNFKIAPYAATTSLRQPVPQSMEKPR